MAFNPFEMMRKRGKVILSVVTICIMFIFVLSSGLAGGDFFNDFLPRMFGSGRAAGPALAEGFGRKISAAEVSQTMLFRRAANEYMLRADAALDTQRIRDVDRRMEKLPAATREVIKDFVDSRQKVMDAQTKATDDERRAAAQKYNMTLQLERFMMQQAPQQAFSRYTRRLGLLDPEKDKDEAAAIRTVMAVIEKDIQRNSRRQFFRWPNAGEQDAVNFILLKRKADKEGIQYPLEAVNTLVAGDLGGPISVADSAAIEKEMRADNRYGSLRSRDLVQALADEYRVNTVITANYPLDAIVATPREFFDYYKDTTSEIQYAVVEAPVRNFTDKVTDEPKPDELKKLYEKYRTYEYNPRSETPGFKELRRVKVEYLEVDANAKMYAQGGPLVEAATIIGAGMLPGTGPAQAILGATAPLVAEAAAVRRDVDEQLKSNREFKGWSEWNYSFPHDSNVLNPLPIASLAGLLQAPLNPLGYLTASAGYAQLVQTLETRDRVKVGVAWALAGLAPPPQPYLPALTTTAAMLPAELPAAVYEGPVRKKMAREQVAALFFNDMQTFLSKIGTYNLYLTPKADPAKFKQSREDAVKYIIQFAAARGLKLGSSSEVRNRFTLRDDPGLKALADKSPKRPGGADPLAQKFFERSDPRTGQAVAIGEGDATLYQPDWFPFKPTAEDIDKPTAIAWVTEDLPAKAYLNYDLAPPSIKEKVKEAWKFAKARDLAKKAADDFAVKAKELAAKTLTGPDKAAAFEDALRDLAGANNLAYRGRVAMSPLKLDTRPTMPNDMGGGRGYVENFAIPSEIAEYPGRMAFAMLDNRSKPLGTTLTQPDEPVSGYYVSILDEKREKQVPDFSTVYRRSFAAGFGGSDPFYNQRFAPHAHNERVRDALERLHAEANYKVDEKQEEALKKNRDAGDEE